MPLPKNYSYSPMPPELSLRSSSIHGHGVFAKEVLKKSVVLSDMHTHTLLSDESVERSAMGGWINHSDSPNCKLVSGKKGGYVRFYITTIEEIKINQELTLDYNIELCGLENNC